MRTVAAQSRAREQAVASYFCHGLLAQQDWLGDLAVHVDVIAALDRMKPDAQAGFGNGELLGAVDGARRGFIDALVQLVDVEVEMALGAWASL